MSRLRFFQRDVKEASYRLWAGDPNCKVICPVLPTGGGKTVLMGDVAREYEGYGVAIAHRSELNKQISLALAKEGVRHDIIAPKETIRHIVKAHIDEIGRSYYDARANWQVASVDTIIRRNIDDNRARKVGMVFQDEGHHVLRDNKWGKAFSMFPNAYGFFPTAYTNRADGRGIGRHAEGFVDAIVEGPNLRWFIDNGFLVPYKLMCVTPTDFDMEGVDVSATTGEYNLDQMRARVKQSKSIIGDVVETYIQHAMGKRGITFAVDIEHATWIAAEYNRRGVAAVVVSSETPGTLRDEYMRKLVTGEILQLVNVDLFGEGVDVPVLECVSFARPTASYSLYLQSFGRPLRLDITKLQQQMWDSFTSDVRRQLIADSNKPFAMIFDHVGNIIVHNGPPDYRKDPCTLDSRERKKRAEKSLMRACLNPACLQPYERYNVSCPYCGAEPPLPAERSKPEHVDGDLILYTPELLDKMFGAVQQVDGPPRYHPSMAPEVIGAIKKNHYNRQAAQTQLRTAMGIVMPPTRDERVNNKKFFLDYGIDTLGAKALGSAEAEALRLRIINKVTSQ